MRFAVSAALAIAAFLGTQAVASSAPADKSATVLVSSTKGGSQATATGVIVNVGGGLTILTTAHITQFGGDLQVTTADGETLRTVNVERIDGQDLALVKTAMPHGVFAAVTFTTGFRRGEAVYVWGYKAGGALRLADASIQSAYPKMPDGSATREQFAVDCGDCGVGDSGAGLFDRSGNLVGIVTSGFSRADGTKVMTVAESVSAVAFRFQPRK